MSYNFHKQILPLCLVIACLYSCGPSKAYKDWENNYRKGLVLIGTDSTTKALPFIENAYNIATNIFNRKDNELRRTIISYADLNKRLRKREEAVELYQKVISIAKANKNKELQVDLFKQIGLIYKRNDNDASLKYFKSAKKTIEDLGKAESFAYADILYQMSSIYKYKNEFDNAISALDSSNTVVKKLVDSTKQYARNLTMLSQIYLSRGDFEMAIPIQEQSVSHYKTDEDKAMVDYAAAIFTMAVLYHEFDEYEKEIPVYREVMRILGESHSQYDNALNNIAQAYERLGDYENALEYATKSIERADRGSSIYPKRLMNKAYILVTLGNFIEAEVLYQEAIDIMKSKLGESHAEYGKLLNNVGKMYIKKGDLEQAESYFKKALDIFLLNFDKNDKRYGYQLIDYAQVLFKLGKEEEAISLMLNNLDIQKANDRVNSQDYYSFKRSLGGLYNTKERYDKALPLLESVLRQTELISGKEHPIYRKSLWNLSETYIGLKEEAKALNTIDKHNSLLIKQIEDIFKFRSEKEKKLFLNTVVQNFEKLQSLRFNNKDESNKLNAINLNNQLLLKGLLLNNSKNVLLALTSLNDDEINRKILAYKNLKRRLSKLLATPLDKRTLNIDSLSTLINDKETELVQLYTDQFSSVTNLNKDWSELKPKLKAKEIVIEFSHYTTAKNETTYIAYLFRKNSFEPQSVKLFNEKQLLELLKGTSPNSLYATRGSKATSKTNTVGLYELLWSPIEAYLNDIETIYFSPSGLLNQIPFAALGKKEHPILAEQFKMIQLSNSYNLLEEDAKPKLDNTLLIGGINYDYLKDDTKVDSQSKKTVTSLIGDSNGTQSFDNSWKPLPGTLEEVESIKQILDLNNNNVSTWASGVATEKKFKSLSGQSPSVLHIATHGFFFENLELPNTILNENNTNIYKISEDPLMRSGLILAGANYAWNNGANPNEEEDGILTALEISNLDLSQTDLVVLSACETGLGDIEGSEGVYGLQRAFKMAGVNHIIMSLWQVPDKETSEFMALFYKEWIENKTDITEAFKKAQIKMYKAYKDEPLKWAAFVLFK